MINIYSKVLTHLDNDQFPNMRLRKYPVTIHLPSSSVTDFIFTIISVRETFCASSMFGI